MKIAGPRYAHFGHWRSHEILRFHIGPSKTGAKVKSETFGGRAAWPGLAIRPEKTGGNFPEIWGKDLQLGRHANWKNGDAERCRFHCTLSPRMTPVVTRQSQFFFFIGKFRANSGLYEGKPRSRWPTRPKVGLAPVNCQPIQIAHRIHWNQSHKMMQNHAH